VKEKIKIGVIIKSLEIFLWEYRVLEKLFNSGFAEISLLMKVKENPEIFIDNNYSLFYRLHDKLDKHVFKGEYDFNKKINILTLINEVPLVSFESSENNPGDNINKEIPLKIKDLRIDLILNLGGAAIDNLSLKSPRYGIWSYNIGDNRIIRGFPPCYWEIVKKAPEIGCTVIMSRFDFKNEAVIYRTSISAFTQSIYINKNRIYGLASLVIPRLIEGLFLSGDSYLDKTLIKFNNDVEIFSSKVHKSPDSFSALWNLILILTDYLNRNLIYKKEISWHLLFNIYKNGQIFPVFLDRLNKIVAPKGKFWADPFVVTKNGDHYIFVEEYLFKTRKAHISVLKLDKEGNLLSSERIIEKPYHLSYPFIFELNGEYYMIPESRGDRSIQLYICRNFPDKWEFVRNLKEEIAATDSTLFYYSDKWWLFTSVDVLNNPAVPFSELFLYFADDLFSGHWISHPMNPIVTDIKTSRPAGNIFVFNNKIYRPSQDCSGSYGKAFNLNQIVKLSEEFYEEIQISKVEPDWDRKIIGTHTINFNNNIVVIDASPLRKRF